MKHTMHERVRWSDVDVSRVIRWDTYTRFVELAETELFRAAGYPYAKLWESLDIWLPRVQFHLDMRSPPVLDEQLEIEMRVATIGRSSIRLEFTVRRASGETAAEGHLVVVAISRAEGKPVAVPEPLREALGA